MLKNFILFSFLYINNLYISEFQLENLVQFKNKNLQKKFEDKKQIYKNFFIEYMKRFKKPIESFEDKLQEFIFIREFIKNNNINIRYLYYIRPYYKSICYSNKTITEIEIDSEELWIELESSMSALYDLKNENIKNKYKKQIENFIDKICELKLFPPKRKINYILYIKDLQINKNNYIQEIPSLKDDLELINLINEFINSGAFEKDHKKYVHDYVWSFIEFLIYMYEKYEIYLNSGKKQLNKEIEIIQEIIYFTNNYNKNYNKSKNLNWEDIYFRLIDINNQKFYYIDDKGFYYKGNYLFKEIKKIKEDYYLYIIFNEYSYIIKKINNFKKLKKSQIIFNILNKDNLESNNYYLIAERNSSYIYKKYSLILNTILSPGELYYF